MSRDIEVRNGVQLRMAPASPASEVVRGHARFTVLTESLIRMEYSPTGEFRDCATQAVVNRSFPDVHFTVESAGDGVVIRTDKLRLVYRGGPFSPASLSISMLHRAQAAHFTAWHFGDPMDPADPASFNLGGTARTLDDIDGPVDLEPGVVSSSGFAVLDDSHSLPLTEDGWVAPLSEREIDQYFFGYGRDHQGTLDCFFRLTGRSPLLPRRVLGNWWSRFYPYSSDEYLRLMDSFAEEGIPISTAVIDMDWHLVDIDPSLGSGWTGYTWNRELFPNPEQFLADLHRRGMLVTLNVHPADGVRRHEEAYREMALRLGRDPDLGVEIPFDIGDRAFAEAYFECLHRPHEDIGVDFWWVDWQSGSVSSIEGLDPLWMLNYLHYEDNARAAKRPVTFSRYAGVGSHRYPIGFSGDSVISWSSFAFQPYFTATAANVGYFWWSHDIGGHMQGAKDNELATRWLQFGVFSPIMRLHSSRSFFGSKEPKNYGPVAERIMASFMRLRHMLVPYLYTAMWNSYTNGVGPIRPMYHDYPDEAEAYDAKDQYMFGADMLVAPVVTPIQPVSGLAKTIVWLPEGNWTDFFTGRTYHGGRKIAMYRKISTIPVLVRAGAVIVLADDPFADVAVTPSSLTIVIVPGEDGRSQVIEDDGTSDPLPVTTRFQTHWNDNALDLRVLPPHDAGHGSREVHLELSGYSAAGAVTLNSKSVDSSWERTERGIRCSLGQVSWELDSIIHVENLQPYTNKRDEHVWELLNEAEGPFEVKELAWQAYCDQPDLATLISVWDALDMPSHLRGALIEVVTA